MSIGLRRTSISERPHLVTLQNPGPAVSNGDGGVTVSWTPLSPADVFAGIRPPGVQDLERAAAGTVITSGMRVLSMPFHPQVTTQTRALWRDAAGRAHTASVVGVDNPDENCVETVCLCVEQLEPQP